MKDIRLIKDQAVILGIIRPDGSEFEIETVDTDTTSVNEMMDTIIKSAKDHNGIMETINYFIKKGLISDEFVIENVVEGTLIYDLLERELKANNYFRKKDQDNSEINLF